MSEEQSKYEADRKRREYRIHLDSETMPQEVVDAVLDLQDVMDDLHTLARTPEAERTLTDFRDFLTRHWFTLHRSNETFAKAVVLYAEVAINDAKKVEP